jgi:ribonuclease HI
MTDPPIDTRIPRGQAIYIPVVRVHFDGACQPPQGGIATYGFTVEGEGLDFEDGGLAVPPGSERATNNVAEYVGAIRALEHLRARGFQGSVTVLGDSQLIIRQMNGEYEVRTPHLLPYHERLGQLSREFTQVQFGWVPREENTRADELSKRALFEAQRQRDAAKRRR